MHAGSRESLARSGPEPTTAADAPSGGVQDNPAAPPPAPAAEPIRSRINATSDVADAPGQARTDPAADAAPAASAGLPPDAAADAGPPIALAPSAAISPATISPATISPTDAAPSPWRAPSPFAVQSRADPPAQLATAVAVLAQRGDGAHRLTMRLDPAELGHIEIVVDRRRGMPSAVTLTVERPDTLLRLLRDQDQLARALDQAGLHAEGRKVEFQLASPASHGPADPPRPAPSPAGAPAAVFVSDMGQGDPAGDGGNEGGRRDNPAVRSTWASWRHEAPGDAGSVPDLLPVRTIAARRGIDITA